LSVMILHCRRRSQNHLTCIVWCAVLRAAEYCCFGDGRISSRPPGNVARTLLTDKKRNAISAFRFFAIRPSMPVVYTFSVDSSSSVLSRNSLAAKRAAAPPANATPIPEFLLSPSPVPVEGRVATVDVPPAAGGAGVVGVPGLCGLCGLCGFSRHVPSAHR
jgi:hypothetical protein